MRRLLFGVFGRLGDGKTLALTYLTFEHWFKRREKIYSNYHLFKIPYYYIHGINQLNFPKGTRENPCWMCFEKGTKIITYNKIKNIEDITTDDFVLTHKSRFKKVNNVMARYYDGEMLKIKTRKYNLEQSVTPEHPFLVFSNENYIWKAAKDLIVGDKLCLPIYNKTMEKKEISCFNCHGNHLMKRGHYNGKQRFECSDCKKSFIEKYKTVPKIFDYNDPDVCYILGLFVADGHANFNAGKIRFAVNGIVTEKIKNKLESVFKVKTKIYRYKNYDEVTLNSTKLTKIMNAFGKGDNKTPPFEIINSNEECRDSFLEGYIDGDGCREKCGITAFSTISPNIFFVVSQILLKKGIIPSTNILPSHKREINGYFCNFKDTYRVRYSERFNLIGEIKDNYCLIPINKIEKRSYSGLVYNLEVEEDNSYSLMNCVVHNCVDELWRIIKARTPMLKQNDIVYDILGRSRKRSVQWAFSSQLKNSMDKLVVDVLDFISKPTLTPDNALCRLDIFAGAKASAATLVNSVRFWTYPFMNMFSSEEEIDLESVVEGDPPLIFQPYFNEEHGFCCECEECGTKFFKDWAACDLWATQWWETHWKEVFDEKLLQKSIEGEE